MLPPRVRLPSPTIVRPPLATAAAASLCTRGLGHKPLVLGAFGSFSGTAVPAGSSNSGDTRPGAAGSGRSGNLSPPPNPFTAHAAAGGELEAHLGQELRQENGSNPGPGPAGRAEEGPGRASTSPSPALRLGERIAGLESLLALVASGTAG